MTSRFDDGKREAARTILREYIRPAIKTFDGDPPDSEFQRGYLRQLKDMARDIEADLNR